MFALILGYPLAFWYGSECVFGNSRCPSHLQKPNPFTTGRIVTVFYSLFIPSFSLNQLTPCFQKIAEGMKAAAKIYAVIDRIPLIKSKENA